MKRIEDIKEFEDIDTYYDISDIVAEVFKDRVEAHKHLVTANKEIKRLNNIINRAIEAINVYQNEKTLSVRYQDLNRIRGILRGNEFDLKIFEKYLQELKGEDKE